MSRRRASGSRTPSPDRTTSPSQPPWRRALLPNRLPPSSTACPSWIAVLSPSSARRFRRNSPPDGCHHIHGRGSATDSAHATFLVPSLRVWQSTGTRPPSAFRPAVLAASPSAAAPSRAVQLANQSALVWRSGRALERGRGRPERGRRAGLPEGTVPVGAPVHPYTDEWECTTINMLVPRRRCDLNPPDLSAA